MNKLEVFLEQLGLQGKMPVLSAGTLERVKVYVEDIYEMYITLDHPLPFEEYEQLMKHCHLFPYPVHFLFHVVSPSYDATLILNYYRYFLEKLKLEHSGCAFMSQLETSCDENKIQIEVINEIQLDQTKEYISLLEKEFQGVGLNVSMSVFINKKDEIFDSIIKEMEQEKTVVVEPQKKKSIQTSGYSKKGPGKYFERPKQPLELTRLEDIKGDLPFVMVEGYIFKTEDKTFQNGTTLQSLWITDYTDSIRVKYFQSKYFTLEKMEMLRPGKKWVQVTGEVRYDAYDKTVLILANRVEVIEHDEDIPQDTSENKRIELHTHTKMSTMDGIGTISEYAKRVSQWGHEAIAVCDHGNVQSFPEAQSAAKQYGLKMIYGVEMNMVDTHLHIVENVRPCSFKDLTFVSFDIETTGFSVYHNEMIEFGAVKIKNGEIIDRLQAFTKPSHPIPVRITNLTHITNDMVKDALSPEDFLDTILDFFGDHVLVAHNAKFDVGFINEICKRVGKQPLNNPVVDSLALARVILKPMKSYRLGAVARVYRVNYDDEVAHRADYDAEILGNVFSMMIHQMLKDHIDHLEVLNTLQNENEIYQLVFPYHMTMLAKNKVGLKNMFKLVSMANTEYFSGGVARIPKNKLEKYREGLLFGSSCYNSDVFEACMNSSDERLKELVAFYDYIEIQPFEDYYHLIDRGKINSEEELKISIQRLISAAKACHKLVVVSGDVHFLNKRDKIFRDVFIANPLIGVNHTIHPLCNRRDPKAWTPYQYLRTTDEMLAAFDFLPASEVYEYVVTNTHLIADMIEEIKPIHDKLFTPTIDGADENLKEICYRQAHAQYGEVLPEIVEKRLEKELGNIIKHGFGVIYYIAHRLVKKSNDDGYLVGSRGSVGSSFVATMAGITEVNPLPPHYFCPQCQHSEFIEDESVVDGYDLPDKYCPVCGALMKGDGHNIPFETFLGFNADKVPDIDLNFSGDYQSKAHDYTKVLFGEDKVFRAGTISTVAEKTAFGYARGYSELIGANYTMREAEIERIAMGCQKVKRTTGQHPGGIIVIPRDMDVYDFTPVQYPADDLSSSWKTTHFDFHAIHDNVLKLDILGHVDPTVIRMLQDLTGVDPKSIPTNDQRVMSLFSSSKALDIDLSYIQCSTGALGLPEFGTPFVRGMLEQTQPKTFGDLVIISGLSHGTDVYLNNAESLIREGICQLNEVIGCRDDIMVYLISKGLPNKDAFDIMECVRKGKSPKVFPEKQYEELMREYDVPQWYIDSCKKIKYMFPKAHAVAYVLSAIRVAWWKLYYPREYYAVYFTTRSDAFEIETMIKGKEAVLARYHEIKSLMDEHKSSKKDEDLFVSFEIMLEMFDRGYHFNNIDIDRSYASQFILDPEDEKGILPPFVSVDGLGLSVAESIVEARHQQPFLSKEDVFTRTSLNNTLIKTMTKLGILNHLQEENQLSLF